MPKHLDSRSRGARAARYAFAALCVGVGVLSMSDSGWALRLKAEGYYADLQVELFGPQFATAGTGDSVVAYIRNDGPEPVEQYTLLFKVDPVVTVLAPECEWTHDSGVYSCVFDRPLAVNAEAVHDVSVWFNAFFEGATAVGMLASSPLHDPEAANSFAVVPVWVAPGYDVRVEIDPAGARPGPDGRHVSVRLFNDGPSAALDLRVEASLSGEASGNAPMACVLSHDGYCSDGTWVGLYPNGYVELDVLLPTASPNGAGYVLEVRAIVRADAELDPGDNSATFRYAIPLFASGFE